MSTAETFRTRVLLPSQAWLAREQAIRRDIEADWRAEQCPACRGRGTVPVGVPAAIPFVAQAPCPRCDGVRVKCPIMPHADEIRSNRVVAAMRMVYDRLKEIELRPFAVGEPVEWGSQAAVVGRDYRLTSMTILVRIDVKIADSSVRMHSVPAHELYRPRLVHDVRMALWSDEAVATYDNSDANAEELRRIWFWEPAETALTAGALS